MEKIIGGHLGYPSGHEQKAGPGTLKEPKSKKGWAENIHRSSLLTRIREEMQTQTDTEKTQTQTKREI